MSNTVKSHDNLWQHASQALDGLILSIKFYNTFGFLEGSTHLKDYGN